MNTININTNDMAVATGTCIVANPDSCLTITTNRNTIWDICDTVNKVISFSKPKTGKFGGFINENLYITKVISNDPAYIVFWSDGTKTTAICSEAEETFDPEKALLVCVLKKMQGGEWLHKLLFDWTIYEDAAGANTWTLADVRKAHRILEK